VHWQQAKLALTVYAAAWHDRPVGSITRRDVRELIEPLVEARGKYAANRAHSHLRKFFNEMVARDVIVTSPCNGLARPTAHEKARERALTDIEIRDLWQALDQIDSPASAAIKVMLLTAQRRSEVADMTWAEIDGDQWMLPGARAKNGKSHMVPLAPLARGVIDSQPHVNEFVFASRGGRIVNFKRTKDRLDKLMQSREPWVIHDLRRTAATGMARLGVALPVIEKVLNHSSGSFRGVVGVYQRHDFAGEKRAALDAWGAYVADLIL
jgi:integrase